MSIKVPKIKLSDGYEIPAMGLGTWGSPAAQTTQAVKDAIDIGCRYIDNGSFYQNEKEVGEGINAKIAEGVIKREDIFVTSSIWNTEHRPDLVRPACETSLKNLNLSYVNLYLMLSPMAYKEGDELFPQTPDGKLAFSYVDYIDTWKEMEKLVDDGLAKSMGLANFNRKQIERILEIARIPPVNIQIECHPYLNQRRLIAFCKSKDIVVSAYSPLGSPARPGVKPDDPVLLEDPKIVAIAKNYKKTPAQILIRYQIQRGNVVISKSVTKSRIQSNFDVFGFELSAQDQADIDSLDRNGRLLIFPHAFGHPHHPFENDDF